MKLTTILNMEVSHTTQHLLSSGLYRRLRNGIVLKCFAAAQLDSAPNPALLFMLSLKQLKLVGYTTDSEFSPQNK